MNEPFDKLNYTTEAFDPAAMHTEFHELDSHSIKLLSNDTVPFVRTLAEELLCMDQFQAERPLRDAHVARLQTCMREGTFRPELVTLAVAKYQGRKIRINGQHCSWAVVTLEPKDLPKMQVRYLTYSVKTDDDLRQLYSSFDRAAPRTQSHLLNAQLLGTAEFEGVGKDALGRLIDGMMVWQYASSSERSYVSPEGRAHLMRTHRDLAMLVVPLFGSRCREHYHVQRAPTIGAMFATASMRPNVAAEFWDAVRTGENLPTGDVRLKLRNMLLVSTMSHSANKVGHKEWVSGEELYRSCVLAWNAFREGRQLTSFRTNMKSGERPIVKG